MAHLKNSKSILRKSSGIRPDILLAWLKKLACPKEKSEHYLGKKTDTFFDAQQAVEWGIADEII